MDLFRSTTFLHLVIGVWIINSLQEEPLNVHLEPKNITVCEGDSVTINCTFQPGGKYIVKLYYSLTSDLGCYSPTVRTSENWRINTGNDDTWSIFNINSIKIEDSGWYFCKVTRDIPVLLQKCSDGIQVLVDTKSIQEYPNQTDNQTQNHTTADLPTNVFFNTLQEEQLNVHLEPKYIKVCEGDSVTINCTFQPGGKYKVKLYYSLTPDLGCYSPTVRTSEKWRINTEINDTCSIFNISSIKTEDSGWYFCKVTRDIPFLEEKCSDGIQVLVEYFCIYSEGGLLFKAHFVPNLGMDRLCARIILLLVTGVLISNTLQEEPLNVHLEPKNITVCEGDSVIINCTFQPGGKYKVKWHYSLTPDLGCSTVRTGEKWRIINTGNNDTWSIFNISSIKTEDRGWYFCKVTREIPFLEEKCSDGIQVLVVGQQPTDNSSQEHPKPSDPNTTTCTTSATTPIQTLPPISDSPSHSQWWIWLAMAVGCVVLVVSIVVIYIFTRKTKEIIYENTKPVESGCCRRNRNQMEISNLAASKKTETIKPLRKYDTLSSNRNRRP